MPYNVYVKVRVTGYVKSRRREIARGKGVPVSSARFTVQPGELAFIGGGLHRPECVLCLASGALLVSDWRGGVSRILPDGTQCHWLGEHPRGGPLQPNGIALSANGTLLIAHLGTEHGGVFRLLPQGRVETVVAAVDGIDLPPTNFPLEDAAGRLWITVSTRLKPRALGYRPTACDGFIVMADASGARIVADGLGYTNELALHPNGRELWVNETFARRLSRFAIRRGGTLGEKQVVATFGAGTFPDGLAFDAEGGAWITSIVSNRVIRVAPDGAQQTILEDAEAAHLDWVEKAFLSSTMGRPHLDKPAGKVLQNTSSLAFGGKDLRTAYLGSLQGPRLATFPVPLAGFPPPHWKRQLDSSYEAT